MGPRLGPPAPNPFVAGAGGAGAGAAGAGSSRLQFVIPVAADVELGVYDVRGRAVRALASGHFAAGPSDVSWDGRDDAGRPVAPGIYFVAGRLDRTPVHARLTVLR
jgi:flagellar hook assembly protein FlgD